jgi:hypothetical protein
MAISASKTSTDKPETAELTDVHYKGGPMGGQHRRFVGELESTVQSHGGSYSLDRADDGTASYVWNADADRRVPFATDGDEASHALGDGAGNVVVDETKGVRTDGPSISPAAVVQGSGSSKESAGQRRDAAKTGSARPADAPKASK